MTMSREDTRKRTENLKRLREEHKITVERTQALLKEQISVRKKIRSVMRDSPKTVPEIAEATGMAADQVLWHVIALKKYGLAVETGSCDDYYLYQCVGGVEK